MRQDEIAVHDHIMMRMVIITIKFNEIKTKNMARGRGADGMLNGIGGRDNRNAGIRSARTPTVRKIAEEEVDIVEGRSVLSAGGG